MPQDSWDYSKGKSELQGAYEEEMADCLGP